MNKRGGRSNFKRPTKGNNKKSSGINLEEVEDEIDTFSKQKDLVSFEAEDDSEGSEEDQFESVHDLELEEEDEEDEEEEYLGLQDEEDEENEEDLEDEDNEKSLTSEWGKTKKTFYKTDYDDDLDSDLEAAKEEEAEAKRLQKKKAELLAQEDFDEPETLEQLQKSKKTSSKKEDKGSDSSLLASFNRDLDSIDIEDGAVEVENVSRDASSLSQKEKLDIVMNESPELLALIEDFKNKIHEIKNNVQPLYEKSKNGDLPTSKGVSFLEVKYHLLMSYCTNIAFYLLLKAEGKQVKDHPVIDQLVKFRTIIEKLKPIDQKLKYQVDKLLKILATGNLDHLKNDPRSFKPKLDDLVENGEDEEEDDRNAAYVPPKLSEAFYEDRMSKEERKKERSKKRASQGAMMEFINQTYGDRPEELAQLGSRDQIKDREAIERERYEEDNYIRLNLTKKQKHKEALKTFRDDTLEKLAQFDDISSLVEDAEKKGKSQLKILANNLGQNKRKFVNGDVDYDISNLNNPTEEKPEKFSKKRKAESAELPEYGGDSADDLSEDDFYKEVEQAENEKKKKKQQAKKPKFQPYPEDQIDSNKKRAISRNIESTRGLTRSRPKDIKTPHMKSRKRFDNAVKKRRGMVKKSVDKSRPYSGETTGIKAHVKHSVSLK